MTGRPCRIEGCEATVLARDLCTAHYSKWRKYGDPLVDRRRVAKPCLVDGCDVKSHARGMCARHYAASQHVPAPPRNRTAELLARVDMGAGCWNWKLKPDTQGYGRFQWGGSVMMAHAAVWEHFRGPVPAGLELDHLCRNRRCVRPDHLEPVTHRENVLRGEAPTAHNARKNSCVWGHLLTPENTIVRPDGRECKTCARLNGRASKRRRRLARDVPGVRWGVSRVANDVVEPFTAEVTIVGDLVVIRADHLADAAAAIVEMADAQ